MSTPLATRMPLEGREDANLAPETRRPAAHAPEMQTMQPFPHLLVLGHRGAPEAALENTLESFVRAMRDGADGVELDVRSAADGTPVVIHDATLERAFGLDRAVGSLGWEALHRLTGARLPTLQQAAAWAAASGAWLNVELKVGGTERAVVELVVSHGLADRCFLSSFDRGSMTRVAEIAPSLRRFLLLESWSESTAEELARSRAEGVSLRADAASPMAIEVLRRDGFSVVVWTVDDPVRAVTLAEAGVAGIITDRPRPVIEALEAAGLR